MGREGLFALLAAAVWSSGVFVASRLPQPVSSTAVLSGLELQVLEARWVHHEGHDPRVPMPASMMYGAPKDGQHRLSLEVSLHNQGARTQQFTPDELFVEGETARAQSTDGDRFSLPVGSRLYVTVRLDVEEQDSPVTVAWARGSQSRRLLVTRVPKHERSAPSDWPRDVEGLPPGDVERGRELFVRRGCSACHGSFDVPGHATIGPELAGVAEHAGTRVPGTNAAQYLYESLLDPNAFLAPHCPGGRRCAAPSVMPAFDRTLVPAEAADLIALMLSETKREGER